MARTIELTPAQFAGFAEHLSGSDVERGDAIVLTEHAGGNVNLEVRSGGASGPVVDDVEITRGGEV